jgi:hypothetical protein
MPLPPAPLRRNLRLVFGCILFAAGFFGTVRAARAAAAQRLYHGAKHGFFRDTSREVLPVVDYRDPGGGVEPARFAADVAELARRARRGAELYAPNYYFPAFAARAALIQSRQARSRAEFDDAILAALYFSREAVALNPYDAEARYVRAEALAADGQVGEALAFWRPIVEREFWNSANHDEYARLLLLEGSRDSLGLAVREKPLVEGAALRRRLDRLGKSLSKRNPVAAAVPAATMPAGTAGTAAKPSK